MREHLRLRRWCFSKITCAKNRYATRRKKHILSERTMLLKKNWSEHRSSKPSSTCVSSYHCMSCIFIPGVCVAILCELGVE
eukprot:jgi/Antlo1/1516/401